jgi:hypothetical protein
MCSDQMSMEQMLLAQMSMEQIFVDRLLTKCF